MSINFKYGLTKKSKKKGLNGKLRGGKRKIQAGFGGGAP